MDRKNILIIEDELIIAKDLARILRNQNWNVSGICTGVEDAFQKIESLSPDLVLIDIILRGKRQGIDIGRYLASSTTIPFIYVTSFTDRTTIDEVTSTVPAGYVVKPFRSVDIVTAVEVAFATKKRTASIKTTTKEFSLADAPIKLRKVVAHIQEHINEPLKIELLAAMTPWNPHHFIRNFKKYIGETPYQYILKYRVARAKSLLAETDWPISEIAQNLGFSSHSSFSTTFLKIENCTAKSYRRSCRQ